MPRQMAFCPSSRLLILRLSRSSIRRVCSRHWPAFFILSTSVHIAIANATSAAPTHRNVVNASGVTLSIPFHFFRFSLGFRADKPPFQDHCAAADTSFFAHAHPSNRALIHAATSSSFLRCWANSSRLTATVSIPGSGAGSYKRLSHVAAPTTPSTTSPCVA